MTSFQSFGNPTNSLDSYQSFRDRLQSLRDIAGSVMIPEDLSSVLGAAAWLLVEPALVLPEVPAGATGRIQAIAVEVHRSTRLAVHGLRLLAAARQPATQLERLAKVCQELDRLLGYCDVILVAGDREKDCENDRTTDPDDNES